MKYCQNCTRLLADDEVCPCTSQTAPQNSGMPTPAAYNYQNIQNQQAYAQNQNPNAPKKNSSTAIIIIIVVIAVLMFFVLPVIGILAAILVPAMIGYVSKELQAEITSTAKMIYDSYSTALVEMDSEGYDIGKAPFIICSDSYLNIDVPFDDDVIYTKAGKYYDELDNYTYFVVVEKGIVVYVACEINEGRFVGTYPYPTKVNEGPRTYYGYVGNDDWDVDDLYYCTYNDLFEDSCSSGH